MKTNFYCLYFLVLGSIGLLHAGSRSPSPSNQIPYQLPDSLKAEQQKDDFSCGYHALSALYKSYGLNPKKADLRNRLGTSVAAIPFVDDTRGTLQADLYRVLLQDGFLAQGINSFDGENLQLIEEHFNLGQYCLALLRTEKPDGMHWVVFTNCRKGEVTIADSLVNYPYIRNLKKLSQGKLLSVVLLTPSHPQPGSPCHGAHFKGAQQMIVSLWRSVAPVWKVVGLLTIFLCMAGAILLVKRIALRKKSKRTDL